MRNAFAALRRVVRQHDGDIVVSRDLPVCGHDRLHVLLIVLVAVVRLHYGVDEDDANLVLPAEIAERSHFVGTELRWRSVGDLEGVVGPESMATPCMTASGSRS